MRCLLRRGLFGRNNKPDIAHAQRDQGYRTLRTLIGRGSLWSSALRRSQRKGNDLSQVTLREWETQESLLKRFNTAVQRSGLLRDAKRKRFFVSKGEAARDKQRRAASRRRRARS